MQYHKIGWGSKYNIHYEPDGPTPRFNTPEEAAAIREQNKKSPYMLGKRDKKYLRRRARKSATMRAGRP